MTDQLEKNLKTFEQLSDEVKNENVGRTALLHDGKLIDIYNDDADAYRTGCRIYGLGNFSLEIFGQKPVSFGWRSQFIKASDACA